MKAPTNHTYTDVSHNTSLSRIGVTLVLVQVANKVLQQLVEFSHLSLVELDVALSQSLENTNLASGFGSGYASLVTGAS